MSNGTSKLDQLTPEQRRLLALRLKTRKADEPRAPAVQEGAGGEYPLAFTQQRLWMLDRLQPGSAAYNMPVAARFRQPLDPAVVERAIGEIVRRHGSLRTRFQEREGGPVQVVEPFTAFHLPVDDLSALPQAEREAQLARIAADEATTPFALDRGAFRARLVRLGKADVAVLATLHHIVSDGWSLSVFWREFQELVAAFGAGLASPLPPLPVQFGEHARRERERLSGAALDGLLAWWRAELQGAPTLLEIPTDHPRPAVASQRGAAYVTELDGSLAERAAALALREGTTAFNVLLAAFQLLMGRYADADDLLVGTAVAGRRTRDVEPLIGFFANTLVLRADLSGEPSFRQLLARVHAATMAAFEHQDLPFERLVEEMAPERTLAYSPLVQALFVQQTSHPDQGRGEGGDDSVEGVHQELNAAKFDLTFGVAQEGGRTWAGVEYAADLFERSTIERMVRHYATLLDSALSSPDAPAAALEMMPPEERAAVRAMGAAVVHHPVSTTLHAAFAAQAARTPDAPALTFGDRTLTYAQLDAQADALARRLRARGAGADVLVGLCVERSPQTVIGILGILKAGAAYLPLDPAYPDDRLAYMLDDSGARLVVTWRDAADRLPSSIQRIGMDEDEDPADFHTDLTSAEVSPHALAYVIYTSGSTGRPKGVQVTHANVVRLMTATDPWFGFGPDDVWTLFHSYAFDFSVWEIWGALLYGGRLVVVPFEVSRDPARFHALLESERVTVLNQTPSAFRQLIRADDEAAARGEMADLALRNVIFGGEALDPASLRGWVERRGADRPRLVNMYGITETTVHVTYRVISADDVRGGSASPIGVPIPDLSVHLLDRRGRIVPVGLAGEMYVGGGGVARGYLHRPELTAQRFVPDPFADDADARLYRSGDLARRRADGSLEFLGRADDQVKVRGFRIELGEIESVLLEHSAVREAVVLARGAGDERRLVAWTVASTDVAAADLRAHLLRHLPEYMVPSAFVPMERLPLTRNGKVDRRALPEPEAADVAGAEYVAPRTQTEQVVAALWAQLLGVERVGATDRFFDLGGQSLLATRAVARVREALGVEVPVRAVFEHPALEAFAAEVDRLLRASAGLEAPPIRPADRSGDLPLSFAQERLWFVDRLEPGSPVYHMPFHYLLRGPLNVDALRRAFTEIVRRHETLRTALPFTGEEPVQRVLAAAPVDLPLHDVTHLADEAERDAATEAVMRQVAERAFDLERGPLFRAALVRMTADEHVLMVNLHHVISDGWSVGVLWNELSALYGAFSRGEASPLPEPALQYGDFAVWQRAWLSGQVLDAQLGYWRRKLAGAPPLLELPTDRPRPAVQTYAGAAESVVIAGDDARAVLALGRREGSTLFMVLLAAMDVVLGRLAGQDDVVIGTPIAGRTRAETEGMIGLFLNSLALRTDLSGEPTFRELLRRVRETTLEAYAHQDLPFERILEELAPERSLSHSPLFQVMLNLSNFAEGDVSLPGLELQPVGGAGEMASKFDLTLYSGETPDGIVLHLVYNTALFDAPRVRSMLAQMTGVLRQAAADPNRPIHAYTLLTDDARALLPDPAAPLSAEWRGSVPAIFARHAAATPHALAVQDPAERWSYAQLDAASDAIARRLTADGVRAGDVVAILGHRGAALVRALLGTMKAGGAFLILDPAYPPARLAEYVRIARPTGFLPIAAAGDVPAELADALRETVACTIVLRPGGSDAVLGSPATIAGEEPGAFTDKVANIGSADDAEKRPPGQDAGRAVREGGLREFPAANSFAPAGAAAATDVAFADKVADGSTDDAENRPSRQDGGLAVREGGLREFPAANSFAPEGAPANAAATDAGFAHNVADIGSAADAAVMDKVADFRPVEIGPDSLAYLSFTSGTTGRPKAVMGRHGSLTHFTPWLAQRFELRASDRFSLLSGLAHDPLHRDVFTPLQLGAAVVAPDPEQVGRPGYLARWMRDELITVAHLTPAMGQLLTDVPGGLSVDDDLPLSASNERGGGRGEGPLRIDSLRRAFFVGDVLTRTDVGRMHRLAPNLSVINYYGSTETQRAVAHFVVPRDLSELARETIPVGTGIPDVQVLIRNAAGERVGVGEVGEMWMRSPHVALGYLGDPELTASRFVPNPWTGDAADFTYRTGDLGRYRPDGVAEIAGRADQQVKIRGFRIEPGEIEAALRAHSAVRDTVVVPRGEGDGKRLVAWVVAEGEPAPGELREWLRARVPDYMLPAAWVFLAALPVTPNGKVDRKALSEPDAEGAVRGFVAPRTPTEVALAGVWAGLMHAGRVGADDDFFALGGHSLLATRLVARVRDAFGVELPLRTLFEAPTLSAMAAAVDRLLRADLVSAAPPIVHRPHDGTAPASFAQERLWFVDRMDGGGAVYHIPSAQLLTGPVDREAMRRAVEEVVRRHETLRTSMPLVDGVPVQRISPPGRVELPFADISGLQDDEQHTEARRLADRNANDPFDLEAGPLFRASLVKVSDDEHLLLVNLHHVIGDGWSMRVLLGEIAALHAAYRRGDDDSPLAPLPVQYADYAAWQREWLNGPVLDAQLAYWRQALAGAPPVLALPTDRPRPPVQGHRGASEFLRIAPDDAARLAQLARREGATLFMVLLAALDVVLARWSGQDDVVVGTPVAGRTRSELEGLVGLFLNSLALRTDLSGDPSFRALLGRVRETTLQAYAHQDLPFERVLQHLKPDRGLGHTPVFQVMLNLLNYGDGSAAPDGEMTSLGAGAQLASKFDVTLYAAEAQDGITLHAVYDAGLFDAARMREMLAQLTAVLAQAAEDPDRPLHALSLRTDDARGVLPDPTIPIEPEAWRGAVHERVAAVAAARPDAPAVRDPHGTWTYARVAAAADRVAHRLIEAGVRPGQVVAVLAHRSAALVPALLGAWRAGAAFLVLDPAYPPARLAEYVRVAGPRALVRVPAAGDVPAAVADALASSSLAIVSAGEMEDDAPPSVPAVAVGPDDLAYVAFTSGTTGEPKAIAGTHRALPHFFGWYARSFGLGPSDRFSLLSGLAHDPLLRDLFAPLLAGGTLVIPDPDEIGTPGYLAEWMRGEGVTVAHLTPAMGQVLTSGVEDDDQLPLSSPDSRAEGGEGKRSALRLACFGGEALRPHDVRRLRAFAPGVTIANFYGATETPQAMAAFVVPDDADALPPVVPVGRGIEGVDLLVLRPDGSLAAIGEVGEIVIRTPYLSRGYLNDDALTGARFAVNPATGDARDRMYRTGDLGRYRPDGIVQVAGRADQQVKLRGYRIEPGEVEAALRAHPGVRDAAVTARGEGDARRLVAYLVARGERVDAAEVRGALRGRLPEHMVPSAIVWLDALPLTPNGKLDRRALPDPQTAAGPGGFVAPRTPTEEVLAEAWGALLRVERVGATDDFFALGGHSLLATRLSARVRQAFGVELPLHAVFQSPTLSALAADVDARRRAGQRLEAPPLRRAPRDGDAPASFQQERLWFLDRLEGGGAVYHLPSTHRLSGALDVEAMRRAVEALVHRHETLRTALPEVDGVPVQRVLAADRVELPLLDLRGAGDDDERRAQLERAAREHADRPFDLERGPLFRAALVRMADDEHVLLACLHHAVADGWSSGVLWRDLSALYAAFARGEPSPLRPLPLQYADYAAWQRDWLRGEVLERQLSYWRERLAGAPALLRLPVDRPRPPVQTHAGASAWLDLPREVRDGAVALGRAEGATLFMVLLSAFGAVLGRLAGEEDVVVGTPVAGRTRAELEGLIGPFINTLALRTDVSGHPTFRDLLRRVRESTLEAYAHQDVPFERVIDAARAERSTAHTPVFQVMLNLFNFGAEERRLDGARVEATGAGTQAASKFDLTLYAGESPAGLGLHCLYNPDLFDDARMRALLAQVAGVLRQAAEDPDRPLSALSLGMDQARPPVDADAAPVVVRTRAGRPAGIGELGEVWMRGPDGALRPMGGAGRYRPDGSVELAAAPSAETSPAAAPPAPKPAEAAARAASATERAVAAIWAEVLGIAPAGIAAGDDFFALGGHSLRATQVLSRIRARLGVTIPIRAFFAAPTVAALASAVDAQAPAAAPHASVSTEPAPDATDPADAPLSHSRTLALSHFPPGVYPLSFAQRRLWVLMQLGATSAYHLSSALRMEGPLDTWALERALDEMVRRHEALRTRIEDRGGDPVQVVQPPRPLRLRVDDVRPAEGEPPADALRRMADEESARPFPAGGPYLRVRLLRIADDDHALLWTLHHLVADGWSMGIFQTELVALYTAFATDADAELPALRMQYGEHALAQRRELDGPALDRLVGWWKERLAGAPALLELPADHPRPAHPGGAGASLWFGFPEGTAERVARVARERGATPFMVLLAAFQALLSRWSGQDDVVVGTPIANRTRPELEPLIGFFANTLAIRGDLSGDPSFAALLDRVRDATLGAYEHQDVPFERLVEELNPERSLGHTPVFQVMFALQNVPKAVRGPRAAGLTLNPLPRAREAVQFDLSLALHETPDGLAARLEYATGLFQAASMEAFAEQFVRLLEAALDDPARPVAALPLLDAAERARLLEDAAAAAAEPPHATLHGWFAAQAARAPGAWALVWDGGSLSYAELGARARTAALRLLDAGVRPGDAVAVLAEQSPDAVVALLGTMMAGGAFLPLDPAGPAERLAFTLGDARAAAVLAQPHLAGVLPPMELPLLLLGGDDADDAPGGALPDVHPASPAYVLYTSGSTGRPKGVAVSHAAAVAHLVAGIDRYGIVPDDVALAFAAITFDPWMEQVLGPLCAGATAALRDPEVWSPAELARAVERLGITVVSPPTAYWHHLVDDRASAVALKRALRMVVCGGEAMRPDAAARWAALPGGAALTNAYGPTEAVVTALSWRAEGHVAAAAARLPIGTPLAGRVARVLDARGEPVPAGVPGELYLGGAALADGYHRRPALTAASFVPDPFAARPGARLYRTGDRVRMRPDGLVEYLGRMDQQVKVRGFRIEPGEIEAALRAAPGVADAAVVLRPGAAGTPALVGYVVPAAGARVDADELRRVCAERMPPYMVPAAFVTMDALPLTPNGKVDRRALPAPDAPAAGGYVVPRDVTELEVARIWGEALGVARVGAADDFFRLGGHSLLGLRMMARIRERFGRELPLAALFRSPTVAAFAGELRREGASADDEGLLVTLNAGGALPPLFFLPPAGGTVTHYADLARRMGPEQPFLALHAPGLTGAEAPLDSVEALAARFVREIRAAQPRGPYWLGGWSVGGVTAFEAARQLRAAGEQVALLAIVDAPAPDGTREGVPRDAVEMFRDYVQSTVTEDEALLDGLVDELRALPAEERVAGLSRWIGRHGGQVMDTEVERIGRALTVFAASARAVRAYRSPPPLAGVPVALFVATEGKADDGMGPDVLPGRWRPFVDGEMAVHAIPGVHVHLVLDPAVQTLAARLRELLEQARTAEPLVDLLGRSALRVPLGMERPDQAPPGFLGRCEHSTEFGKERALTS